MSDIIADNRDLAEYCDAYMKVCETLSKQIAAFEEGSKEIENVSQAFEEQRLCIQLLMHELQILKMQQTFLKTKILEKQILILRNKFTKIITDYQKIFIPQIPASMQEVAKRLEVIGLEHETQWLRDLRMLGLALSFFEHFTQKSNSSVIVLSYQYQFAAIFRNSIMCKNLRPKLGEDNSLCNLRRKQLTIFYQFAETQITNQRTAFARTQSTDSLDKAIRLTRGLVELGFITESEFFDTEYYKKQDEALTKLLVETKDASKK